MRAWDHVVERTWLDAPFGRFGESTYAYCVWELHEEDIELVLACSCRIIAKASTVGVFRLLPLVSRRQSICDSLDYVVNIHRTLCGHCAVDLQHLDCVQVNIHRTSCPGHLIRGALMIARHLSEV